jgi:hypothetical protein
MSMLVTSGSLLRTYQEQPNAPYRLGRHLELDGRSAPYFIENELRGALRLPVKPAEHLPGISILDQLQTKSCTGNGGTYALSSAYGSSLAAIRLDGLGLSSYDAVANEKFALALYHEATVKDGFPGTYPPEDTGSSGLGVCRALKAAKLVKGYNFATSVHGVGVLFQRGGLMVGTPWYEAWFEPDAQGFIDSDPHWLSSGVAGGHEIYWASLESWDDRQPEKSVVAFANSWSSSWGDGGYGRLRLSSYLQLQPEVDVKQLQAKQ